MSATGVPGPPPAPAPLRCPRCGAEVGPAQDWCLECGAPARTRLAPAPSWRLPVALVAVVVLAAGVLMAVAFAKLTDDDGVVTTPATAAAPAQPNDTVTTTATVPTAPPVTQTAPGAVSTPAPAPATTTPAAATTPPAPTTPAATTPAPATQTTPG